MTSEGIELEILDTEKWDFTITKKRSWYMKVPFDSVLDMFHQGIKHDASITFLCLLHMAYLAKTPRVYVNYCYLSSRLFIKKQRVIAILDELNSAGFIYLQTLSVTYNRIEKKRIDIVADDAGASKAPDKIANLFDSFESGKIKEVTDKVPSNTKAPSKTVDSSESIE